MNVGAISPVAPLAAHQLLVFLLQVGVLLALATLLGRLATRLGWPAVTGELCAGVLLGPSLLDHIAPGISGWLLPKEPGQLHLLDAAGQIGVLLLVGMTGIYLDFGLIRKRGLTAARVSIAGLMVPLGFGIGAGLLLPSAFLSATSSRVVFALFLGVAMCVSAIPVIAKILMDMGLLHRNVGQFMLAVAMVDDAAGWLLLSVVSALPLAALSAGVVVLSTLYLIGVVVFAWLVARPLVRIVLRLASRSAEPAASVAVVVVMLLLAAAGTQALRLEPVFGAFVCGIVIGSSSGLEPAKLASLRTMVVAFFAPLFFATAGLRTDLTTLARPIVLGIALLMLLVAILGKFIGAYIGARLSRLGRWEALALAAGLNARGVIEIVVATVGLRINVLTTETYTIIVVIAVVTSLMAPPILRYAMARVEENTEESVRAASLANF